MDGSSFVRSHPLFAVVAQGGDFDSLRLRVQDWVRKAPDVTFPCRTEVTEIGFVIHYTDREDDTFHHVAIPPVGNCHEYYMQAYEGCGW